MIKEFREFILRGNLVDLAVAVVIGTAFGAVVTAFVADLITPLIAAIGGQPDFSQLTFEINGSKFLYGDFINALLTFVIIAAVIFFFVVKPVNALMERYKTETDVDRETRRVPSVPQRDPARGPPVLLLHRRGRGPHRLAARRHPCHVRARSCWQGRASRPGRPRCSRPTARRGAPRRRELPRGPPARSIARRPGCCA